MAKKKVFRVYVDEAGDRGWGGRSSEVFVVSAVIVPDEDDADLRRVLDDINAKLGRDPKTVLHCAQNVKTHPQRKLVARTLGATEAVFTNVIVHKESLIGTGSQLSDPTSQYNYAVRRLLERVSWYVRDRDGEAIVTFAHVRRFPYKKLNDYLELLRQMPTEIAWKHIRRWSINQPSTRRLLQMADLLAGCVYAAVRADEFGDHEATYLRELVPRIYVRGRGRVDSYGMNWVGVRGCPDEYPWWKEFKDACEDRP